jgi:hypothetical protein
LSTTGSVPQLGPAAAGASVAADDSVAGASVATASVAGASVEAGASVAAGAPHAARITELITSRVINDHNLDFIFISLSPS